ncbi:pteridine reductase [Rheinheimera sp. SA_1]|uniref:pteridine reductase n=1 Tax=Rheinheimera sp. SA_1 TaxID=1827365 RepID=UPI0008010714|nr:pteridine reductase [Rheinheimera sp. SA_1]OBP13506.1 pteridine reductase [Rheinheimera sp. SA_1]
MSEIPVHYGTLSAPPTKVALVTGSAKRLGREIILRLHQAGFRVIVHCRQSTVEAQQLCQQLNIIRPDSACWLRADLNNAQALGEFAAAVPGQFGQLDLLVNNASSFYPTPVGTATLTQWDDLFGSNVKAPFFLTQALAPELYKQKGCVINLVDIHAEKPLAQHSVYCMAKAALAMMTRSLARDLAPTIRVNGIAPGAILWPSEQTTAVMPTLTEQDKAGILAQIPLGHLGQPTDIAQTVLFLATAPYITGQILAVDGGRSLGGTTKA